MLLLEADSWASLGTNLPCGTGLSAYNRAMAIVEFDELKANLPREGRLMALDVGSKTVGIATSDVLRSLATPLTTLKRSKLAADLAALAELAAKHEVKALAVGLPLNMDGTEGPRCQSVRQFAANIAQPRPAGARRPAGACSRTSGSAPPP